MKNLLLTFCAIMALSLTARAQSGWSIGANGAVPTGTTADFTSVSLGADVAYHLPVTPLLDVGVTTGYGRFFGKEYDTGFGTFEAEDYSYIPLAASANVNATEKIFAGLQAGYAIATGEDAQGGFLYRVRGGYGINRMIDLYAFYQGISNDGEEVNAVGAGLIFDIL